VGLPVGLLEGLAEDEGFELEDEDEEEELLGFEDDDDEDEDVAEVEAGRGAWEGSILLARTARVAEQRKHRRASSEIRE